MQSAKFSDNHISRLRFEAYANLATEINKCVSLNEVGDTLATQIKYLFDSQVFRVAFRYQNKLIQLRIARGTYTAKEEESTRISDFEQDLLTKKIPKIFLRKDLENDEFIWPYIKDNNKLNVFSVLPNSNANYSLIVVNATKEDSKDLATDFKFLSMLSELLGGKLIQLVILVELEKQREELAIRNNEILEFNKRLESMVEVRTRKLEQTTQDLHNLFYGATHSMRTPLTNIQGIVEIGTMITKEKQILELFNDCKLSAQQLDNTLQKLNILGSTSLASEQKEISINTIIENCKKRLKEKLEICKGEITLSGRIYDTLLINKIYLEIVLFNLLENSLIFNRNTPVIAINIGRLPNMLILTVSDNGIGMSEKVQDESFTMFYRGSQLSNGAGLGLYVVKKLIENLNGDVRIQSSTPQGTTIIIELPYKDSSAT